MYKVIVFIPTDKKEIVKMSMFEAGGGKIGNYDCCSFEMIGTGQFRALEGSDPYVGKIGEVESVSEVISAMKKSHPYEEPAFDLIKLQNI